MPRRKITSQLDPLYASRGSTRLNPEVDFIPNGWVWTLDDKGNYLSVSPQVTEFLGFTAEHFLGQPVFTCQVKSEDHEAISDCIEKSIKRTIHVTMIAESGIELPVELELRPEKDSGGN